MKDISPLAGMPLTKLTLPAKRSVLDLTPLIGMRLKTLELMSCHQLQDLTPLQGLQLTVLGLAEGKKWRFHAPKKPAPWSTRYS